MDVKQLLEKIQNIVDPILTGIIVFLILNIGAAALLVMSYSAEIPEYGVDVSRRAARRPEEYKPYFIDQEVEEDLPEDYEPLLYYNFFQPLFTREEGPSHITPIIDHRPPDDDDDGDNGVEGQDPVPLILPPLRGVYLTGVVNSPFGGIAQVRTDEAEAVFSVREGSYIPNTDIIIKKVLDNGVIIWKNGHRETFITFEREENLRMLRQ